MGTKADSNKMQKEAALQQAAFDLFNTTGINSTTVDDIVKKAGVAKGTFYLYFKDKYDILDRIVIRKTSALIQDAIAATKAKALADRVDRVICFIDFIIDALSHDRLLVRIIYKNLSYSLFHKVIEDPKRGGDFKEVVEEFKLNFVNSGYTEKQIGNLMFIILEMTGSVCYSAIINNEPGPIEEVKPMLLKTIRKILE
jgi:AcrR family transcriptional regulator